MTDDPDEGDAHITRREFAKMGALAATSALAADTASASDRSLAFRSAGELAALIASGDVSSLELTHYFIDRIERHDDRINAVVVRDFERALEAAQSADDARAAGRAIGPLHGVPMTIKESYDIAGLPSSWGNPEYRDDIAEADSVVVSRLKAAGAHFLGKTNVPIHLADFQSYNAIYGQTNNPWDLSRGPGGSSGGSAAALAAGLTGLECGSDIGGSIRNPAHYCGVFGHKPSWGIVPSRGHNLPGTPRIAQDIDLAVLGPLARSAEDLALSLQLISGPDVLMSPGWDLNLPEPGIAALNGLRVALWPDSGQAPVDAEIADRVVSVGEHLAERGAMVSDTARPDISVGGAREVYGTLLSPLMGGPEFDIGYQEWLVANGRRGVMRHAWQAFFEDWDVVLCPISATTAFPHDHSPMTSRTLMIAGTQRSYWQQVFWAGLATMPLLPSTVFPTGPSKTGLPIGLQAIGAPFADYRTIEVARLITAELGGFRAPEGFGD